VPEGYDKLVVADIIVLLIEALKGIGATDNCRSYGLTPTSTTTIRARSYAIPTGTCGLPGEATAR
jgi:hypothetical protein